MSSLHEVISALLDDEPFDAQELEGALSHPEGRSLLIDLVALGRIVQPPEVLLPIPRPVAPVLRFPWRPAAAAAALVVALVGGYLAGTTRSPATPSEAPAPTRIIETTATWEAMPPGGRR